MQEFDKLIRAHREVIYYARYVDDMVIVFAPRPNSSVNDFFPFVKKQAADLGLTLNPIKTREFDLRTSKACELEYLGYKIAFGQGPVIIGLSDGTKRKYKRRVERSFGAYLDGAKLDEKKARRLLVKRIQFLTGNTRLLNNKHHVMIGMFYSNSHLSSKNELEDLDVCLKKQTSLIKSAPLRNRLGRLAFGNGFSERRFQQFTARQLSQIVELWKHEA
jgi:hypothetical protein